MREFYAIMPTVRWDNPHPVIHIWGVDIPLNATAINEVLEVPEVSNAEYEAKLSEMDLGWLRDTLIEPARRDQVYWATAEGITSTDWSLDAKRWLHLVTSRIRLSGNRGGGVRHIGYKAKCWGADHFRVKDVLPRQQKGILPTGIHHRAVQTGGGATS